MRVPVNVFVCKVYHMHAGVAKYAWSMRHALCLLF